MDVSAQASSLSILHVSDVHFGPPEVPAQIAAVEALVQERRYDVVAISGDVTQRARAREFRKGLAWMHRLRQASATIVVPGNHDIPWWRSPLHLFGAGVLYSKYRTHFASDLEPVLELPGARFVGINTAQGVHPRTLTKRPRDISIIGDLRPSQLAWARDAFATAPPGQLRVAVLHHNLTKGELSRRYGLKDPRGAIDALAAMGVGLVLTGHDHQEQVALHRHVGGSMVMLTAGTISDRSRGKRPSSVFEVLVGPERLDVVTRTWSVEGGVGAFRPTETQCFSR